MYCTFILLDWEIDKGTKGAVSQPKGNGFDPHFTTTKQKLNATSLLLNYKKICTYLWVKASLKLLHSIIVNGKIMFLCELYGSAYWTITELLTSLLSGLHFISSQSRSVLPCHFDYEHLS